LSTLSVVASTRKSTMAPAEPNALPFRPKGDIPAFAEEKDGWRGYIEWEKYPDKKKQAHDILSKYDFPDVSLHKFDTASSKLNHMDSPLSSSSYHSLQQTPFSRASAGSSTTQHAASTIWLTKAGKLC